MEHIVKELNTAFAEFKDDHQQHLQKQDEQLQNQAKQLQTTNETLDALIAKMTKLPGVESPANGYSNKDLDDFLRSGDKEYLQKSGMEIAVESAGGVLHVPTLGKQIIDSVAEINPLLSEVNQITIGSNKYEQIFTISRSASARAAESETRNETNTAVFAKVSIELFDLYAKPKITNELLHSTGFMPGQWLQRDVQEAFNEALAVEFISGDGNKQSVGLLNSTDDTTIDGAPPLPWGSLHKETFSTSIKYADLLAVISALPVRYKAAGNVKWYMSTAGIEAIRGLKDANDLPIWRQDFGIAGSPMVLLGYPVVEVPQLDVTAFPLLFGDMRQTYAFVRHDRGLGIIVDQVTEPGFTKFYLTLQCAGGVMDSRAMVALG